MPAPPLSNTLDQGVDGVNVTTLDPGSPNTFQAISSVAPKYTNVQFHSSPLAMRWVAETASQTAGFTGLGTITTNVYTRFYMFLPSLPSDNNFYPLAYRTAANAGCSILRILADGTIQARSAANSSAFADGTVPVATNQWVRIETRMLPSTDPAVGQMEWRLYNSADSATITDTNISPLGAGVVFGTDVDRINWGMNVTGVVAGLTVYYDDIAVSSTGWIGPAVTNVTVTIINGTQAQLVNVNAAGTDVDAMSYKKTVLLTDTELAALAATPGVMVVADPSPTQMLLIPEQINRIQSS